MVHIEPTGGALPRQSALQMATIRSKVQSPLLIAWDYYNDPKIVSREMAIVFLDAPVFSQIQDFTFVGVNMYSNPFKERFSCLKNYTKKNKLERILSKHLKVLNTYSP